MKNITVWYDGMALSVLESVAKMMNLQNGQRIQSKQVFWEIIRQNAETGIAAIKQSQTIQN